MQQRVATFQQLILLSKFEPLWLKIGTTIPYFYSKQQSKKSQLDNFIVPKFRQKISSQFDISLPHNLPTFPLSTQAHQGQGVGCRRPPSPRSRCPSPSSLQRDMSGWRATPRTGSSQTGARTATPIIITVSPLITLNS